MNEKKMPEALYKIVSIENWKASQSMGNLQLDAADKAFIHFSLKEQLDRIISKYWSGADRFIVLEIDPEKLTGELVYEANSGGVNKYYHLYDGAIPLGSIREVIDSACLI